MAQPELLLTVPTVELHQVHNQQDVLLLKDALTLYLDQGNNQQASSIIAQVGTHSWRLYKTVPCLKSDQHTYIFSIPDQPHTFFCLILPPDTPTFITESFEGVLGSSTDYSTLPMERAPDMAQGVPVTAAGVPVQGAPSQVSKQVSEGLVAGSGMAAQGLVTLAGLAASGIQKLGETVVKNTTPSPTGTMAPETRAKLDKATSAIVTAGAVIKQLANQAGAVADTATKSVSKSINSNESVQKIQANPDVQVLGSATKAAGSQLLVGLKEAAKIIARSTKAAVQQYKAHKYPGEGSSNPTAAAAATGVPVGQPAGQPHVPPPTVSPPPMPFPSAPQYPSAPQPPANLGPAPAGYPTVTPLPQVYAAGPAAPPQQPHSGVYPEVQQPTLYPPQVPPPQPQ